MRARLRYPIDAAADPADGLVLAAFGIELVRLPFRSGQNSELGDDSFRRFPKVAPLEAFLLNEISNKNHPNECVDGITQPCRPVRRRTFTDGLDKFGSPSDPGISHRQLHDWAAQRCNPDDRMIGTRTISTRMKIFRPGVL